MPRKIRKLESYFKIAEAKIVKQDTVQHMFSNVETVTPGPSGKINQVENQNSVIFGGNSKHCLAFSRSKDSLLMPDDTLPDNELPHLRDGVTDKTDKTCDKTILQAVLCDHNYALPPNSLEDNLTNDLTSRTDVQAGADVFEEGEDRSMDETSLESPKLRAYSPGLWNEFPLFKLSSLLST